MKISFLVNPIFLIPKWHFENFPEFSIFFSYEKNKIVTQLSVIYPLNIYAFITSLLFFACCAPIKNYPVNLIFINSKKNTLEKISC